MSGIINEQREQEERIAIAVAYLRALGQFPGHVQNGKKDYTMTITSIQRFIPLDWNVWYPDGEFEKLPPQVQTEIQDVITNLLTPPFDEQKLKERCSVCYDLAITLSTKMVKLMVEIQTTVT